jgi:hypothetical protein
LRSGISASWRDGPLEGREEHLGVQQPDRAARHDEVACAKRGFGAERLQERREGVLAAACGEPIRMLRLIVESQEGLDVPEVERLRADVEVPVPHPVHRDTHDAPACLHRHIAPHAPARRAR